MKKIINLTIAIAFFVNSTCYGLGIEPASNRPGVRGPMRTLAERKFLAQNGAGVLGEILSHPFVWRTFTVSPDQVRFIPNPDYANPPEDWKKYPIFKKYPNFKNIDFMKALTYYMAEEAKIPEGFLEIRPRRLSEKENAIAITELHEIKNREGKTIRCILEVDENFIRVFNDIKEHDVWFTYRFPDGQERTVSVAWGLFNWVAKHVMTDLEKTTGLPKGTGIGHILAVPGFEPEIVRSETITNFIGGRFALITQAIKLFVLCSYYMDDERRYNPLAFLKRAEWIFNKEAQDAPRKNGAPPLKLYEEFPELMANPEARAYAIDLADCIRQYYFERPGVKPLEIPSSEGEGVEPKLRTGADREFRAGDKAMAARAAYEEHPAKAQYLNDLTDLTSRLHIGVARIRKARKEGIMRGDIAQSRLLTVTAYPILRNEGDKTNDIVFHVNINTRMPTFWGKVNIGIIDEKTGEIVSVASLDDEKHACIFRNIDNSRNYKFKVMGEEAMAPQEGEIGKFVGTILNSRDIEVKRLEEIKGAYQGRPTESISGPNRQYLVTFEGKPGYIVDVPDNRDTRLDYLASVKVRVIKDDNSVMILALQKSEPRYEKVIRRLETLSASTEPLQTAGGRPFRAESEETPAGKQPTVKLTVLLADESIIRRNFITDSISKLPGAEIDIVEATSTEQAADLLKNGTVDLAVCSLEREIHGVKLAQQHKKTKFVFLNSKPQEASLEHAPSAVAKIVANLIKHKQRTIAHAAAAVSKDNVTKAEGTKDDGVAETPVTPRPTSVIQYYLDGLERILERKRAALDGILELRRKNIYPLDTKLGRRISANLRHAEKNRRRDIRHLEKQKKELMAEIDWLVANVTEATPKHRREITQAIREALRDAKMPEKLAEFDEALMQALVAVEAQAATADLEYRIAELNRQIHVATGLKEERSEGKDRANAGFLERQIAGLKKQRTALQAELARLGNFQAAAKSMRTGADREFRAEEGTGQEINKRLAAFLKRYNIDPKKTFLFAMSGGDCAGPNSAYYAAVKKAAKRGYSMLGVINGFDGLGVEPNDFATSLMIYTSKVIDIVKDMPSLYIGSSRAKFSDRKDNVLANCRPFAGALFIGGDDHSKQAAELHECGIPTVVLPKTIDYDFLAESMGAHVAASEGRRLVFRAHEMAKEEKFVQVVELMGRDTGWITYLASQGLGEGAFTLLPEKPSYFTDVLIKALETISENGYLTIPMAEGYNFMDFTEKHKEAEDTLFYEFLKIVPFLNEKFHSKGQFDAHGNPKLGGISEYLSLAIRYIPQLVARIQDKLPQMDKDDENRKDYERIIDLYYGLKAKYPGYFGRDVRYYRDGEVMTNVRLSIPGYVLRGLAPDEYESRLGEWYGRYGIQLLLKGKSGLEVTVDKSRRIGTVDWLKKRMMKSVPIRDIARKEYVARVVKIDGGKDDEKKFALGDTTIAQGGVWWAGSEELIKDKAIQPRPGKIDLGRGTKEEARKLFLSSAISAATHNTTSIFGFREVEGLDADAITLYAADQNPAGRIPAYQRYSLDETKGGTMILLSSKPSYLKDILLEAVKRMAKDVIIKDEKRTVKKVPRGYVNLAISDNYKLLDFVGRTPLFNRLLELDPVLNARYEFNRYFFDRGEPGFMELLSTFVSAVTYLPQLAESDEELKAGIDELRKKRPEIFGKDPAKEGKLIIKSVRLNMPNQALGRRMPKPGLRELWRSGVWWKKNRYAQNEKRKPMQTAAGRPFRVEGLQESEIGKFIDSVLNSENIEVKRLEEVKGAWQGRPTESISGPNKQYLVSFEGKPRYIVDVPDNRDTRHDYLASVKVRVIKDDNSAMICALQKSEPRYEKVIQKLETLSARPIPTMKTSGGREFRAGDEKAPATVKLTVLLADEWITRRESITNSIRNLQGAEIDIVEATSTEQAADLLKNGTVDLAVCSLEREIHGVKLAQQHKMTKFVFLDSKSQEVSLEQAPLAAAKIAANLIKHKQRTIAHVAAAQPEPMRTGGDREFRAGSKYEKPTNLLTQLYPQLSTVSTQQAEPPTHLLKITHPTPMRTGAGRPFDSVADGSLAQDSLRSEFRAGETEPTVDKPLKKADVERARNHEGESVEAAIPKGVAVKDITTIEIVYEFIARIARGEGPGPIEEADGLVDENTQTALWKLVNLFHKDKMEIFIPQREIKLTSTTEGALREARNKKGNILDWAPYVDKEHLAKQLENADRTSPEVKRLIITTGKEGARAIQELLAERPELFKNKRLLNIELPENYQGMGNKEKTVWQIDMLTKAIFSRLYVNDGSKESVMIRGVLQDLFEGKVTNLNEFLDKLGEPDKQTETNEDIKARINYFLGKIVKLLELLDRELRIMRVFWTYA